MQEGTFQWYSFSNTLTGDKALKDETIEMRGVSREDLISFFRETGWREVSPGLWRGKHGSMEMGEQSKVSLGSIRLPSVTLVFRLRKSAFDEVLSAFRARFLRAGG